MAIGLGRRLSTPRHARANRLIDTPAQQEPIMTSEQKVAIVTGASQGIGASVMRGLRHTGYAVVANSRSILQRGVAGDPDIL
jgi:3-oxoacyl-ACP reductase-like protein